MTSSTVIRSRAHVREIAPPGWGRQKRWEKKRFSASALVSHLGLLWQNGSSYQKKNQDHHHCKDFLNNLVFESVWNYSVSTVNILETLASLKQGSVLLKYLYWSQWWAETDWPHLEAANSNSVSLSDFLSTLWETEQVCIQIWKKSCV